MEIYKQLTALDLAVMVAYVCSVVALGAWVSFRKRNREENLFLAQHSLRWPTVGLNMWGTNVGPSMLIASASIGYTTGTVAGNFSWYAFPFILFLALVFAPHYLRTKTSTLPEFVGKRFNQTTRELLAWYSVVTILFSWLGITLYAGGILVSQIMDWPLWVSIASLTGISAFFTISGGLRTIAHTNVFQMALLIIASSILTIVGLVKVGGIATLAESVPQDYWRLFLPMDNAVYPWHAILLGYPVLGVWFWCTDQSMVQSVLGARSLKQGQLGTNFTAWLKILDVPLFILPGILCCVLFPGLENPDEAYLTMVVNLLPSGMVGLIVTVIMAALISTIASALNSLSTILTLDVYVRRYRPAASQREVVFLGRAITLGGAGVSVFVALLIASAEGMDLFSLFQTILGFLAPPITTVFLVGVLWKRATSLAANVILSLGTVISLGIGVCFFAKFPNETFWPHFLVLAFLICAGLCVLMIVVSLFGGDKQGEGARLSLGDTLREREPTAAIVKWLWAALVLVMITLYIVFN